MSTEPTIKNENLWAAVKGSGLSTLILFVLLICSIFFIPATPEDDGHIRGAAIIIGFLPVVFGVLFIYFLVLSAKQNRPLKFALIIQSILVSPIVILVLVAAYKGAGLYVALLNALYTFGFFSFVVGLGSWAWSKPQKHITKSSNNDAASGAV